jgi:rhomboid protease GluP
MAFGFTPHSTTTEKWGGFFSLFVPREGYFVTPILVDLNLAIFVLMAVTGAGFFQPSTQSLISWGANVRMLTLSGQWWRIFTDFFITSASFMLYLICTRCCISGSCWNVN